MTNQNKSLFTTNHIHFHQHAQKLLKHQHTNTKSKALTYILLSHAKQLENYSYCVHTHCHILTIILGPSQHYWCCVLSTLLAIWRRNNKLHKSHNPIWEGVDIVHLRSWMFIIYLIMMYRTLTPYIHSQKFILYYWILYYYILRHIVHSEYNLFIVTDWKLKERTWRYKGKIKLELRYEHRRGSKQIRLRGW